MGPASNSGEPTLWLRNGTKLNLNGKIAAGGEGRIFSLGDDPSKAAKVYYKIDPGKALKLEAMLKAVPDDPSVEKRGQVSLCWPQDLVVSAQGETVGFLMPLLDTTTHHAVALLWNPEDRAEIAPGFTWKHLCVAASNICSLVELIHGKNHVIGDLNEENILINGRAVATVVDCDSMQIRDPESGKVFRSTVTREAYISPGLLGKSMSEIDRTIQDDYWALGVLIFQMLMEGQHPTNGIGYPEERDERIRRGLFPLLGEPGFAPPKYTPPIEILPESIRQLFIRCFRDGHGNVKARPSAFEWRCELQMLAGALNQCTNADLHWYPAHLTTCPWCEQKQLVGIDRFSPLIIAPRRTTSSNAITKPSATAGAGVSSASTGTTSSSQSQPVSAPGTGDRTILVIVAAFVVLIIGILIAVSINNANERQRAEAARIEAQRQEEVRQEAERRRIEEERQRAEAERQRQAQEQLEVLQASQTADALDEIISQRAAVLGPSVIRITVHNQCSGGGPILLAATFQLPDRSERWVTEGWWEIKPNERIQLNAATTNGHVYFYGHSNDGKQWTGDDDSQAINAEVVDNKFGYVRGGPALGKNKRNVKMFHRLYESGGNTLNLVCNQ
jgi:hypothetical protein